MRRITDAQRRMRLAVRHRLAPGARAGSALEAARSVVALHATDPASVYLAVAARTDGVTPADIEGELYEQRTLLRMLAMRRTMFVVPTDDAPILEAAAAKAIAAQIRRRYCKLLAEAGVGDPEGEWLAEVERATLRALRARGQATGAQLSADVPLLRTSLVMAEGKKYEARVNITTWVLNQLGADGRIARGRPRGSWTSSQYSWSPMEAWLPGGLPEVPIEQARAELVRRWLAAFGPGTVADIRWWTGWTATAVRQALAVVKPVEVELDGGGAGLVLADDADPDPDPPAAADQRPWVALLPALDPTAMGWTERAWYLGPHAPALFDRAGNIGPSVWCDGRIVGGWAHRPTGEVAYRLLEDIGAEATEAVGEAAAALADWIGPVRVLPRFRTPLERELNPPRPGGSRGQPHGLTADPRLGLGP